MSAFVNCLLTVTDIQAKCIKFKFELLVFMYYNMGSPIGSHYNKRIITTVDKLILSNFVKN